jgi:ABC-type transport system involved in multi-copper enzyme maturation permease subunit
MSAYVQIARNTFRETLRQPVFLLVLLSALVLTGLYPLLALFVFGEQAKLVADSTLATSLVFGWITAVLAASHTISREIRNGTVQLVLAKPVSRAGFVIAKTAGILAALTVFVFLTGTAGFLALRTATNDLNPDFMVSLVFYGALVLGCAVGGVANFAARRSFAMTTVLAWVVLLPAALVVASALPLDEPVGVDGVSLLAALTLVWMAVLAMGTLATALSTRLEMIPNMMACAAAFLLGMVSDHLFKHAAEAGNRFAWLAHSLIPNWQHFWLADALAARKAIPVAYVFLAGGYVALLILFFVVLAVLLFRNREVGGQAR